MTTHPTHLRHSNGHPAPRRGGRTAWAPVLGGALAAAVAALVARGAATAGGVRLTVRSGDGVREVGWVSTVVVAFLAAAAGLALLRLLARRKHGPLGWACAAGIVLLISLLGPLGATTLAAGLVLLSLHLVVAAVVAGVAGVTHRAGHWSS